MAFDDLRDLHRRAPQLLGETERHATDASARAAASGVTPTRLRRVYANSSPSLVVANPKHASTLFADAHEAVAKGRAALNSGDRSISVEAARTAESAVALALRLLDAVNRAERELAGPQLRDHCECHLVDGGPGRRRAAFGQRSAGSCG